MITIGADRVDLYPLEVATPLARVETFGKFLGGFPANVAVAASGWGGVRRSSPGPARTRSATTSAGNWGGSAWTPR
ncbi:hypothetical protein SMICM304S_01308 [Streptomyces microflavus]